MKNEKCYMIAVKSSFIILHFSFFLLSLQQNRRYVFKKETFGELIRFGIVGVIATGLHYGIYWVLQHWINVNVAYTIGYFISFLFNYYLSAHFTFREKTSTKNGAGFIGAHAFNYFLQISLFNLFLWLGLSREVAPLAVLVIAVPTNFTLVRFAFKYFKKR